MDYFKFKVCFRRNDDVSETKLGTFIITKSINHLDLKEGCEGFTNIIIVNSKWLDLDDAWKEVIQASSFECKGQYFVSSIYLSK